MSNLCKPVYIVNALPKLRFFSSETETYHFRKQWTTNGSLWSSFFSLQALLQHGIVLEILPGKKSSQWDKIPFSGNGTLHSYHLQALLRMEEGRCGTAGSCWRAYLHFTWPCLGSGIKACLVWKTFQLSWSPRLTLLRGCSRETCMKTTSWFITALPASVQDGVQHQRGSLRPRAVKTS